MAILFKIMIEALAGTFLMTVFSYVLAQIFGKRFLEPELLNLLLNRNHLQIFRRKETIAGWILHYLVGLIFVVLYESIWMWYNIVPGLASILILGIASGLMGVTAWQVMLSLSRRPPKIDRKSYFAHLVAAHVVFVFGVVLMRRMLMEI